MVILPEHKLLICNPPKTGTTTIMASVEKINRFPRDYHTRYSQHVILRDMEADGVIDSDKFFCMCMIRNPWDRVVSYYEYIRKSSPHPFHERTLGMPFNKFVPKFMSSMKSCYYWAQDCDQIIMFESIRESLTQVFRMFNVPHKPIPHLNRTKRKPIEEYYTTTTLKEMVEQQYILDVEIGGYSFPYGL